MSEPSGFERPQAWKKLDDPAPAPTPAAPPETGGRSRRRRRGKRPAGFGTRAAGPDFHWPSAPAGPAPKAPGAASPTRMKNLTQLRPVVDPPTRLPVRTRVRRDQRGRDAGAQLDRARRRLAWSLGLLAVFFVGLIVLGMVSRASVSGTRPRPVPTTGTSTPSSQLGARWTLPAPSLRPDLAKAELVGDVDGTFDDHRVIDAGQAWVVLTGDANDNAVWVHGLDPGSGRELWKHALDNGLCAADLVGTAVLCASAIEQDPATGLGTRWHLALLDPATGDERNGVDWTGWLTLLHVDGDRVLLVEQRQPAPHAVLTVLNGSLQQRAQLDLREQSQHEGLFSDNRIFSRKLPIPDGPALDRPRVRQVADGLTALWAGRTTVFVDLAKAALVSMPRCSRLVDDGERLWCNQGNLAAALSYSLTPLYETDLGTRLAFPDRDPRAGDVTDPVFLRTDGGAVRVDLTTGRTVGPLVNSRNGSAFGMVTAPRTAFVDGITLVSDSSQLFAVKARTGELLWQQQNPAHFDAAYAWDGRLLLTGYQLRVVDPDSGTVVRSYRQTLGLYTRPVAEALVGVGPDELARLVDP